MPPKVNPKAVKAKAAAVKAKPPPPKRKAESADAKEPKQKKHKPEPAEPKKKKKIKDTKEAKTEEEAPKKWKPMPFRMTTQYPVEGSGGSQWSKVVYSDSEKMKSLSDFVERQVAAYDYMLVTMGCGKEASAKALDCMKRALFSAKL